MQNDSRVDGYADVWESIHRLATRFHCPNLEGSEEWADVCESMEELHIDIFGMSQVELHNTRRLK
jgi:hypothetical protein